MLTAADEVVRNVHFKALELAAAIVTTKNGNFDLKISDYMKISMIFFQSYNYTLKKPPNLNTNM
jgi:hypothetical protein